MRVRLADYEYEWAAFVGLRRLTARIDSPNAAHYDERRMESDLNAKIAAACCELAVAKATNRFWAGHFWDARDHAEHKRIADVGTNIEVRRVRDPANPFAVRKRDVDEGRVMFAAYAEAPLYRDVTVYGWLPAADAWAKGTPAHYDRNATRLVELAYLRTIDERKEAA